ARIPVGAAGRSRRAHPRRSWPSGDRFDLSLGGPGLHRFEAEATPHAAVAPPPGRQLQQTAWAAGTFARRGRGLLLAAHLLPFARFAAAVVRSQGAPPRLEKLQAPLQPRHPPRAPPPAFRAPRF